MKLKITASICNRIIEAAIILLIIFAPIYYGSVTLVPVTIIKLAILFMLLVWGIKIAIQEKFEFRRTPLDIFILLFCGYSAIITIFFSKYSYVSYMELSIVLCISALYFIVVNHIRSRAQLMRIFMVILIAGFIHAFTHLLGNAAGLYRASTGVIFNVGNHFAGYMVIIIPLALATSFAVRDMGKRIILLFAAVIMTAAMAFSLIAGAMLAFLLSLIFIGLLFARMGRTRKQALILVGVLFCSILVILWFGHERVWDELLTVTNLDEGSPAGRLSLWKSSFAMFADNPILGTGLGTFDYIYPKYRLPDTYRRAVYAHSDWLQLLTETGIIGFVIVAFGVIFFLIWALRKLPLEKISDDWMKGLAIGGLSGICAALAHAVVEFNFHIPAVAVLLAIVVALIAVILLNSRDAMRDSSTKKSSHWNFRLPLSARVGSLACLLLIVGFAAVAMIRPCIADSYFQSGMELEVDLRWDEAADKYRAAAEIVEGNSEYHHALASVYARRIRLTGKTNLHEKWTKFALAACKRAIDTCPTKGDHHLLLGDLYSAVGNAVEEAENAYLNAISLDPNNAYYRMKYGRFCLKEGKVERSVAEFRQALEVYPSFLYNILIHSYAVLNTGYEAPGIDVEHPVVEVAQKFCPQGARSRLVLADYFANKGWHNLALSEYQKVATSNRDRIDVRMRLSGLLIRLNKVDEAIGLWGEFLKIHPQDSQAHGQLASVYARQNRLDEAIQQYMAAASLASDETDYLMKSADLYMRQKKFAEALEIWQTVIKKYPHRALAHYRIGQYYESQGNWVDALHAFQRAIGEAPRNIAYRMHLAQSYYRRELLYEAINEWKQILRIKPNDVAACLRLARVYKQIDLPDESKKYYQRVLEIQTNNKEARNALAEI